MQYELGWVHLEEKGPFYAMQGKTPPTVILEIQKQLLCKHTIIPLNLYIDIASTVLLFNLWLHHNSQEGPSFVFHCSDQIVFF